MELPGMPRAAWDAIEGILRPPGDLFRARSAEFPAASKLWRVVVATTLHAIWIERLRRRMEDSTLPTEAHIARARNHLRRTLTRFRNLTNQPGNEEEGRHLARVRVALADTTLLYDRLTLPHQLHMDEQATNLFLW